MILTLVQIIITYSNLTLQGVSPPSPSCILYLFPLRVKILFLNHINIFTFFPYYIAYIKTVLKLLSKLSNV